MNFKYLIYKQIFVEFDRVANFKIIPVKNLVISYRIRNGRFFISIKILYNNKEYIMFDVNVEKTRDF